MSNENKGMFMYHHRGIFVRGPPFEYRGGIRTKNVIDDSDLLCTHDMLQFVVDLGYKGVCIRHIYYRPEGANEEPPRLLSGDSSIIDIIQIIKEIGFVDVFVDHDVNVANLDAELLQLPGNDEGSDGNGRDDNADGDDDFAVGDEEGDNDAADGDGEVGSDFSDDDAPYVNDWESTDDEQWDDLGDNRNEAEFLLNREEARRERRPAFNLPVPPRKRKRNAETTSMKYKHLPSHIRSEKGKIPIPKKSHIYGPLARKKDIIVDSESDVDEEVVEPGDENLSREDIAKLLREESEDEAEFYVDDAPLVRVINGEIWYNPNCRVPHFEVGMRFTDHIEFKEAVIKHSTKRQCNLMHLKNEPKRQGYVCNGNIKCDWRIFASYDKFVKAFMIKSFQQKHVCGRTWDNDLLTEKVLAQHFKALVSSKPFVKPADLVTIAYSELSANVSWDKCWREKWKVLKKLEGNYKDEYAELEAYAAYMMTVNKDNSVRLLTTREKEGDPPKFQRFYMCLKVARDAWKAGCRRIFGVDGCFLKGIAEGILLVAVGRDANEQQFPIAWAVVESENTESWTWFFENLRHDLDLEDGRGYTMISDQHKAISAAKDRVLPVIELRFCVRHIYSNWQKRHKGAELRTAFWNCAKATFKQEWEEKMQILRSISEDAYNDLAIIPGKFYCKAFIDVGVSCASIDNNMCESFNSCILKGRCLPIISMFKWIENKLLVRNRDRYLSINDWAGDVSPNAQLLVDESVKAAKDCELVWAGWGRYKVNDKRYIHEVDFRTRTCTCRKWELSGLPCVHVARAISYEGWDVMRFVSPFYKKDRYIATYSTPLEISRGREMWKNNVKERIQPPPVRIRPGRPKKNRRKAKDEPKKVKPGQTVQMTRTGKPVTCSLCKMQGHNKRTCKNQPNASQNSNVASTSQGTQSTQQRSQSSQQKMRTQGNLFTSTKEIPAIEVRTTQNVEGIWIREGPCRNTTATRPSNNTISGTSASNGKTKATTGKTKGPAKPTGKTTRGKGNVKTKPNGKASTGKGKAPWKF